MIQAGGKTSGSIIKSTTTLVHGTIKPDKTKSGLKKITEAEVRGIEIWDEEKFVATIGGLTVPLHPVPNPPKRKTPLDLPADEENIPSNKHAPIKKAPQEKKGSNPNLLGVTHGEDEEVPGRSIMGLTDDDEPLAHRDKKQRGRPKKGT